MNARSSNTLAPGYLAVQKNGWLKAHRWLIARRVTQLSTLALFLLGPWMGIWIIKGNLSASMILDVVPLADPYVLLQTMFTGHIPETTLILGAPIVGAGYLLLGGRVYCAWVCPVNLVTDAAHWLRKYFDLTGKLKIQRATRYWVLGMTLVASMATGMAAWELVNPVSMLHRGLIFWAGTGWIIVLCVFLFDLAISERGWCGRLCPMGAFYSLLALASPVRVSAINREQCNDCMDCYRICPEPQVIKPVLTSAGQGKSPIILSPACTNCGRCIDVCTEDVFEFTTRFRKHKVSNTPGTMEIES